MWLAFQWQSMVTLFFSSLACSATTRNEREQVI
jgi:hypothetical protein